MPFGTENILSEMSLLRHSHTLLDHYRLKSGIEGLEKQLERLERALSSEFLYWNNDNNDLINQIVTVAETLKFLQIILKEYSTKILIETNFTTRLSQCEKRLKSIAFESGLTL